MEKITAQFAAGETKIFEVAGSYFEIATATGPVDVVLETASGLRIAGLRQIDESVYYRSRTLFRHITITSATAQVVDFFVGPGEAGSRRFAGKVTGTVNAVISGYTNETPLPVNVLNQATDLRMTRLAQKNPGDNIYIGSADYTASTFAALAVTNHGFSGLKNIAGQILIKGFRYTGFNMSGNVNVSAALFDTAALATTTNGNSGSPKNTNFPVDTARATSWTAPSTSLPAFQLLPICGALLLNNEQRYVQFDKAVFMQAGQAFLIGANSSAHSGFIYTDIEYERVA